MPVTWTGHRRGVRILAHRGAPEPGTPENTVPAISAVLAAGADGVEVDLRLSADGVLVACHDADLVRLTGKQCGIAGATWDQLRRSAGFPIARVEWVLAAAAGRPVVLELKPQHVRAAAVLVDRLAGLHAARLPLDVTVSSFDRSLVRAVRRIAPPQLRLRTALLGRRGAPAITTLHHALIDGHDEVHPHVDDLLASPEVVGHDVAVVCWTVNAPRQLRRCEALGVTAVITDVPQTAREELGVVRPGLGESAEA